MREALKGYNINKVDPSGVAWVEATVMSPRDALARLDQERAVKRSGEIVWLDDADDAELGDVEDSLREELDDREIVGMLEALGLDLARLAKNAERLGRRLPEGVTREKLEAVERHSRGGARDLVAEVGVLRMELELEPLGEVEDA